MCDCITFKVIGFTLLKCCIMLDH